MQIMDLIESTGNTWIAENMVEGMQIDLSACVTKKVRNKKYYTTSTIAKKEKEIADMVCQKLFDKRKVVDIRSISFFIEKWEWENKTTLSDEQRAAVFMAVRNPISILTGGPGTGKTRVIEAVAYVTRCLNRKRIVFSAPTGKAARKITESTGNKAYTVHFLAGISKIMTHIKRIICDLLIVDESSMLDFDTFYYLLKALSGSLLLVGDIEQLESVGAGSILRDLIECRYIPITRLTKTYRQKEDNTVFHNLQKIKRGETDLKYDKKFMLLDPIKTDVINLFATNKEIYKDVCCLSPYRTKGDYCTNVLNRKIQAALNKNPKTWKGSVKQIGEDTKTNVVFKEGDSVMNLVNEDVVNGEIGIIRKIDEHGIMVQYDDLFKNYPYSEVGKLTLAYALTVHKSQGSEYPAVIIVLPSGSDMLSRNLLFTAVSRAKEAVIIVGSEESIISAINNDQKYVRITFLAEEITAQYNRRKST